MDRDIVEESTDGVNITRMAHGDVEEGTKVGLFCGPSDTDADKPYVVGSSSNKATEGGTPVSVNKDVHFDDFHKAQEYFEELVEKYDLEEAEFMDNFSATNNRQSMFH